MHFISAIPPEHTGTGLHMLLLGVGEARDIMVACLAVDGPVQLKARDAALGRGMASRGRRGVRVFGCPWRQRSRAEAAG